MYTQLGILIKEEPAGLMRGQERPADLLVLPAVVSWCGAASCVGVGVTEPGKEGALHRGSWAVPEGMLKAAAVYTNEKTIKFKAHNPLIDFEYRPIVFEATSARGEEAEKWW